MALLRDPNGNDLLWAIPLYREVLEWSIFSCPALSDEAIAEVFQSPTSMWKVVDTDGGQPRGFIGLENIRWIDRSAEINIAVLPAVREKGVGTIAGSLMTDFVNKSLGLTRVQAAILDGAPSTKLLSRFGFTKEGTLKKVRFKGGKFVDGHVYAWLAR